MSTPSNNNYAPPQSIVSDVTLNDTDSVKASRGSRFVAVIVDSLIFTIPLSLSYVATFRAMMAGGAHATRANPLAMWALMANTGVPFYIGSLINLILLGVTAMLVYKNGQTIGKRLLGIKVVRTDGSRASFPRILFMRNLLNMLIMFVPLLGGLYALVDPLMIFGSARRCAHDHIADTIVIRA
jgi:uncharacterized RDD family membrane protein YckC